MPCLYSLNSILMLQNGQSAPDFHLQDQNGVFHSLQEFKGKKLALFFYPKDNTPGCTEQACNMRDNIDLLTTHGVSVLGVSIDSVRKHKNFEGKFSLPFPLLADVNKDVVNAYEVWGEKTFWGRKYMGTFRVTFLIDEQG